ncbi:MAG: TonB-dependent receptor [Deltaproteobacteria bacterium]|nr:TonB-dependent receptor [Deltaproteobacteria bacterium]
MMLRGIVATLLCLVAAASADTGAWTGFRALGVAEGQLAVLEFVAVEGMREGGLVESVDVASGVASRCGVSVDCHCAELRKNNHRYGAFGSMGHLGDLWTIELTLVDAHTCTVEGTVFASESLSENEVAPRIAALARRLATPADSVAATATGTERTIDTTPAIVMTITRAQLQALQIRTLDDLLPFMPGYDVIDANWGGLVLNQGLPNTLLFLSNGISLVNGLNGFRSLGRDFRSSFTHVDRIEIVRGPGSVLWGQNAFLGVINMITEIPMRREPVLEAGLSAGTLNTQEAWVRGGQNRGLYRFTASVNAGRRIGPTSRLDDSPQASIGVPAPLPFGNAGVTHPAADTWLDVMVRIAVGKRIEASFQNLTSDIGFEISPSGPLLDEGAGGYWKKTHRLYGLELKQPLYDKPGASVNASVRGSRYEYYSDENFAIQPAWPDGPEPAMGGRDLRLGLRSLQGNDRPRTANQVELRVVHAYDQAIASKLTAGIGLLHMHTPASLATLAGISEEPSAITTSFGSKTFATLSAYAIEELVPVPWLVLSGGSRVQLDRPYASEDPWRFTAAFQGGAAINLGELGAKLVYSEGFRPPDAVQLFSTVGTMGNPDLRPETSRALAFEAHGTIESVLTLRAGADVTRVSDVIILDPIVGDPQFLYKPINQGQIDLLGAYAVAHLSLPLFDGRATYHIGALDETNPVGDGIPLARHTAALAAVWRPFADLSLFARGTFASPRRLRTVTADNAREPVKTLPTIRSAVGVSLADLYAGLDLELSVDNPLLLERDAPYRVDGTSAPLIERRRGTEVFATLRYDR